MWVNLAVVVADHALADQRRSTPLECAVGATQDRLVKYFYSLDRPRYRAASLVRILVLEMKEKEERLSLWKQTVREKRINLTTLNFLFHIEPCVTDRHNI